MIPMIMRQKNVINFFGFEFFKLSSINQIIIPNIIGLTETCI